MSTYKRIDGDYDIVSIDPSAGDNVNITTHTVNVTGNLDVRGNITYIRSEDLTVDDPFITVAGNNTGNVSTAAFQEQGLVAQTSASTFAGLRFNNGTLDWEISPSVSANGAPITSYTAIGTSGSTVPGVPLNSIQFNSSNTFGGSTNLQFDSSTNKLTLQGQAVLGNIGSSPSSVANSAVIYHKASSGVGGSGVYARTATQDVELVDKQAALVYSIIF